MITEENVVRKLRLLETYNILLELYKTDNRYGIRDSSQVDAGLDGTLEEINFWVDGLVTGFILGHFGHKEIAHKIC